jgi:toxin ParE1/3/4
VRKVVWSRSALDDFEALLRYIAAESPQGASRIADEIDRTARSLGEMATGRPGRVLGTYEKPVLHTPFLMAYAIDNGALVILRVIHGKRDWPEGEWPE